MSESVEIETDLRRALEQNEFQVYYQPRVSLQTGQIVGAEALIRWYEPNQGAISPSRFIPIAEATGLIIPIGAWVLETACRQTQIWQSQCSSPIQISVNLSVRQFSQPNLSQWIAEVLQASGLDAEYLELELTESILVKNSAKAKQRLTEIKAAGVKIAIDDFGTGYSSLNYLRQFPFDSLKIDRCFICNLAEETKNAAIVTAIVQMAHSLNLKVVGEGVETEAELTFLRQRACEEIQGYLFSRPLSAPEFQLMLEKGKRLFRD